MGDFDKCNALGWRDENEPPFTEDELAAALDWRQRHAPLFKPGRADRCGHPRPCASVADCVERLAWYFRHLRAIEAHIADGTVEGYVLG